MKTNCSDFSEICEIINKFKTFAIYSHMHTDIDAIGSSLAMKKLLEKLGKTAHVFIDSVFPDNAKILNGVDKINNEKLDAYDVAIVLDCADEKRLGRLVYKFRKNTKTTFQIDHHLENPLFAKTNYVREEASSTCELIYNLVCAIGVSLDKDMAKCMISGILTDTGCLKFSNTEPSTLVVVSKLLEILKISMDEITYPLFNSLTISAFDLKKLSLNKLELVCRGRAGIIILSKEDLESCSATFEDTKGLTDLPMQIAKVKCVVVATQSPYDGIYYISVRTKDDYSSKNIASEFGGGGHIKAAGAKIDEEPKIIREKLIKAISKELEK